MRELKVVDVRRMSTFADWYNVINSRRHRMRILQGEVHGLAADTAHGLGFKYLGPGLFIGTPVSWGAV